MTLNDIEKLGLAIDDRVLFVTADDCQSLITLSPGEASIVFLVKWRWYDLWFVRKKLTKRWQEIYECNRPIHVRFTYMFCEQF